MHSLHVDVKTFQKKILKTSKNVKNVAKIKKKTFKNVDKKRYPLFVLLLA